ncbi:unnamed protein product, partial [Prunus brigantina]
NSWSYLFQVYSFSLSPPSEYSRGFPRANGIFKVQSSCACSVGVCVHTRGHDA